MRTIRKGYYTIDNSDLYWGFIPKYENGTYVKCKVSLFYKKGKYKGVQLESKNYKIYYKNIQHWRTYDVTRGSSY